MNKIIIVGCGFSGSVIARELAEQGQEVLILEKRSHIAGNMYDYFNSKNILIQKYGPHFLNSNKFWIFEYLQKFADLFPHATKLLSFIDGEYVRLPFNFETVMDLLKDGQKAENLYAAFREEFPGADRVPILDLLNSEDAGIKEFADLLFEKAYRTYTSKQWGIPPETIDRSVLDRVPMALNYDERYLNKDFQFLPKPGFTKMFENILDHPNITVALEVDALPKVTFESDKVYYDGEEAKAFIFTGNIDELFSKKFGALPYRSLEFEFEEYEEGSHFPEEIISYPQAAGYTRKTEYRKIMFDQSKVTGSTVVGEFPLDYDANAEIGNVPYYPVVTAESQKIYNQYLSLSEQFTNLFLCGRLAEFRYLNMDACIENAFEKLESIKDYLG